MPNKSPLPTGISTTVSPQPLRFRPAAGLDGRINTNKPEITNSHKYMRTIFTLLLFGGLMHHHAAEGQATPPLVSSAEVPPKLSTYEQINSNVSPENIKFFEDYLSKCPENEVRCVWFFDDHIKVGMVMTIDLQKYEVQTSREVYNWASQCAESRKLSHSQVGAVKAIVSELPPTTPNVLFGKGIHVAYSKDGKVQNKTYDRQAAPKILQRLYDIGGDYVDCQYAKDP